VRRDDGKDGNRINVRRRLFNLASVLSLTLSVAMIPLWIESHRWKRGVAFATSARSFTLIQRYGRICLMTSETDKPQPLHVFRKRQSNFGNNSVDRPAFRFVGFGFERSGYIVASGATRHALLFTVPFWFVMLVIGLVPMCWGLRAWRNAHRRRPGMCAKCGYDLRASPERCPECGTVAATADEIGLPVPPGQT
jgi:hypothetical protein